MILRLQSRHSRCRNQRTSRHRKRNHLYRRHSSKSAHRQDIHAPSLFSFPSDFMVKTIPISQPIEAAKCTNDSTVIFVGIVIASLITLTSSTFNDIQFPFQFLLTPLFLANTDLLIMQELALRQRPIRLDNELSLVAAVIAGHRSAFSDVIAQT